MGSDRYSWDLVGSDDQAPAHLAAARARIAELEAENKALKDATGGSREPTAPQPAATAYYIACRTCGASGGGMDPSAIPHARWCDNTSTDAASRALAEFKKFAGPDTWPDPDDVAQHVAVLSAALRRASLEDIEAAEMRLARFRGAIDVGDSAEVARLMDVPLVPMTEHAPRRDPADMEAHAANRSAGSRVGSVRADGDGPASVDGVLPAGAVDATMALQSLRPEQSRTEAARERALTERAAAWDQERAIVHRGRLVEFAARLELYAKAQTESCFAVPPVWPAEWGPM